MLLFTSVNILFAPPVGDLWRLDPPVRPVPPSLFGMHMHYAGTATPWPAVPMAEWRLWDAYVSWADLEPQKGQWKFDTLDRYVAMANEHHAGLLLVLGQSPTWASARPQERSPYHPGNAAEPKDLDDWRNYVRTVATRYQGKIHEYEIWNEPSLKQFYSGTVDQMVVLTREASQIIHGIDPKTIVVSPSAVGPDGVNWLAKFLAHGGGDYVDVIGFHFYVTPQPPESMLALIRSVQRAMQDHGAQRKPLWNTETGWSHPKPFPSEELAAAYLARSYILNWAAGAERLYWYSWDNHRWVTLETSEADNRTLKPAGKAYQIIYQWLVGARIESCKEDPHHTWTCELHRDAASELHREGASKLTREGASELTRDSTSQWIIWNPSGPQTFSAPEEWHATTITPLLDQARPLTHRQFTIGPVPVLVASLCNGRLSAFLSFQPKQAAFSPARASRAPPA